MGWGWGAGPSHLEPQEGAFHKRPFPLPAKLEQVLGQAPTFFRCANGGLGKQASSLLKATQPTSIRTHSPTSPVSALSAVGRGLASGEGGRWQPGTLGLTSLLPGLSCGVWAQESVCMMTGEGPRLPSRGGGFLFSILMKSSHHR